MAYFTLKGKFKKGLIFKQIYGLTPLEKCKFCDLFKLMFLYSRRAIIISRRSLNRLFSAFLPKKKSRRNVKFLPNFATFLYCWFYCLERLLFYLEDRYTVFLVLFCLKRNVEEMSNCCPKSWTNPFGKMQIFRPICIDVFIV